MAQISGYVGRFAPSPTGPLHLGSLTAALASWVDARAHDGRWLLRIEDIDPQREQAGAAARIVRSLQAHALTWDTPIIYQSERSSLYDEALDQLRHKGRLYACICTRKQLREIARENGNSCYPGLCRDKRLAEGSSALRLTVPPAERTVFKDANYGEVTEFVGQSTGDFIIRRRGPFYAYQLAVVVDDAAQGVTHIVRGADLLDNTARQIVLQQALGYSKPDYLHVPLITDGAQKLSKQSGAKALDDSIPLKNLTRAWYCLNQESPSDRHCASIDAFLAFAVSHWKRDCIGNDSINIQNNKLVHSNG